MKRAAPCALLVLALLAPSAAHAKAPIGEEAPVVGGAARGSAVDLNARASAAAESDWQQSGVDPAVRLTEYQRAFACGASSVRVSTPANGDCTADIGPTDIPDCGGPAPLQPLWRRDRATPTSPWSLWQFVSDWACPQVALPTFTAEDFRRLPLAPAQVTLQPAASTVLINIPTITMAAAPEQLLTTDLLGFPVEVRAVAATYTWDYGDGSAPLVTTSPGRPYPNHDVHHSYARPGTYTITLTTTWTGEYRFAGTSAWTPVDGTATTVSTVPPITAMEARSTLVAEPCTPATC
ncbi:PKD domain-containing protein [Actinotalea ferrariae]|uniref:PKD domain-containing protein n=1 Tax=Actinotalea ferrariae TaxID=1386098 RepID=UPI001C8BBD9A|nr:PKD domain-containing protein [Actinotalea ferrariae]MBX9245513.1 PKD domain-containing protein [Actinotalea ferrariae]